MATTSLEAGAVTPSPEAAVTEERVVEAGRSVLREAADPEKLTRRELRKLVATKLGVDAQTIKTTPALEAALRSTLDTALELPPETTTTTKKDDGQEALLRGRLSVGDGVATWQGSWAFSKKDWQDKKKRRKFRLSSSKFDLDGESKFQGFFKCGLASQQKQEKDVARLKFVKPSGDGGDPYYVVQGRGENKFGTWSIAKGQYDPTKHMMSATRVYDGTLAALASKTDLADDDDDDDYDGDDENHQDDNLDDLTFVRLRGNFVKDEEDSAAVRWTGKWADAGVAFDDDDDAQDSKLLGFEYRGTRKDDVAKLEGHFEWRPPAGGDVQRVDEPIVLRFSSSSSSSQKKGDDDDKKAPTTSEVVKGDGSNSFGLFWIKGRLEGDVLFCRKKFKPRVDDDDDDDLDDEALDDDDDNDDEVKREVAELAEEAAEASRASRGSRDVKDHKEKRRRAAGEDLKAKRREVDKPEDDDQPGPTDVDVMLKHAADLQRALDANDEAALGDLLVAIAPVVVTTDSLKGSRLGEVMNKVKKSATKGSFANADIKMLSTSLVAKWKKVVRGDR